jgi:hypothetical protein
MAPTRKAKKTLSKLPENAATFHGLHDWHQAMFEKLGWMVLSKAKGMNYKVEAYKKSLDRLIASIKHVSSEYTEADRKHDLAVLLMHAECLREFIRKHL